MPGDKRSSERDACLLEAQVVVTDGEQPLDCVVINISEGGARIVIDPAAQLPSFFTLALPVMPDVSHTFCVEMRWRRGTEAGLRFVGAKMSADNSDAEPLKRTA